MKSSVSLFRLFMAVLFFVTILTAGNQSTTYAEDQTVSGNLGVTGEMDVYGNTLNFGSWTTSSSTFGLGITYSEDTNHASTLTLTTTRPVSGWLWQRAPASGTGNLPIMRLSLGNALTLYDQTTPTPSAKIVLDPLGTSVFGTSATFNGINNLMPNQTITGNTSVLTVGLADTRYQVVNAGSNLAVGYGATSNGSPAVAVGYQANASGFGSAAFGNNAVASGVLATSLGVNSTASGQYAVATGVGSQASGVNAVALGFNAVASDDSALAVGNYAQATQPGATAFGENAIASNVHALALGHFSTASGYLASAMGTGSVASGYQSTTVGFASGVSGSSASALGFHSSATGDYALALGNFSSASGINATSLTSSSVATGNYSTAGGRTTASGYYQFAIGYNGLSGGSPNTWVPTDDLFTVGNGIAGPSNAFSVKKNGDTAVGGALTVTSKIVALGPIIVQPQGDLSMGTFTAMPSPTP